MNVRTASNKYANKIKRHLIKLAEEDRLPTDMNNLNVKGITEILLPLFKEIQLLQECKQLKSKIYKL